MTEEVSDNAKDRWAADYSAAQRASSKCLRGEEGDLRTKLNDALKSGWSIQALKAYAVSVWQLPGFDHVTGAAWRLAVEFADSNGCSGGREFLRRFNGNPKRCASEETGREQ